MTSNGLDNERVNISSLYKTLKPFRERELTMKYYFSHIPRCTLSRRGGIAKKMMVIINILFSLPVFSERGRQ